MEASSQLLLFFAASIPVLIVCSAMTSATETAVTAVSDARIRQLAQDGNRRARRLALLLEDRERLIGVLLIANNIFNILGSALATDLFLQMIGNAGVAVATLVMTVMLVIFAEVLPKTYAIRSCETLALRMAPVLHVLVLLLAPVSAVLKRIVRFILALFGIGDTTGDQPVMDELRARIIELRGYSMRDRQRSQMLRGVLDLGRVTVEEIMTHRSSMVSFDAKRTIADALSEIGAARFSRFPLWIGDPDHVVGVLHARDLLEADRSRTLADHMRPATFIPRNVRLERQLEAFQRTRTHMALVVDEHGTIKGLVTLEDVVEEIVGDIFDERDMPADLPAVAADGSLTIDGRVAPRDINRHLDWLLPETEPTLAAILTDHAGRIPAEGEVLVIGRHRITVVKRRGHKLATLRVEAPHEPDDS